MNKKRIILFIIVVIVIGILISTLYSNFRRTDMIAQLQGDLYYLKRNDNLKTELWKSKADLSDPILLASNNDETNANIISFQLADDGQIKYIAMHNGKWTVRSLDSVSDKEPKVSAENLDEKSMLLKTNFYNYNLNDTNSIGRLFSENGNIMLEKPTGKIEELLHYNGIYDAKFSSGFGSPKWSPDEKYITFVYNGYRTPFTSIFASMILGILNLDDHNTQTYIMEYGSKRYYKYLKGSSVIWD